MAASTDGGSGLYRRAVGTDTSQAGGRAVVYLEATGSATVLNPTGTLLWSKLEVPASASTLASALQETYPALDAETAARDVEAFLCSLCDAGLLVAA